MHEASPRQGHSTLSAADMRKTAEDGIVAPHFRQPMNKQRGKGRVATQNTVVRATTGHLEIARSAISRLKIKIKRKIKITQEGEEVKEGDGE